MDALLGLICFGLFLIGGVTLLAELFRGYAPILRRFSKNPRFGLLTVLEMFLGAAVFFALLQGFGGIGVLNIFLALLAAASIMGLIHLVFGDAFELYTRPSKPKEPGSDDPWEEHKSDRLQFGAEEKEGESPPEL